jgi:AcrR family transcriptional regulator
MASMSVREDLVQAAIRLLESGGPEALQARKLAAEAGTSTMAIYTHFGGMPQLLDAVCGEGFAMLGQRESEVPESGDPSDYLLNLGIAYYEHAHAHPQLYRLMFGVTSPGGLPGRVAEPTTPAAIDAHAQGQTAFGYLVRAVSRLGTAEDPEAGAMQLWCAIHGFVLLELSGHLGEDAVIRVLLPLGEKLIAGSRRA